MQAQSTPSFVCRRKGCVSNFEDKCEYGHELPNVGMKSVNVIILKRFWLPLAVAVAVASGRRLSISKGFLPSDWPWRFSATATSPSIFACILYLVSTLFIFERGNKEVKRGHQDIKTTTKMWAKFLSKFLLHCSVSLILNWSDLHCAAVAFFWVFHSDKLRIFCDFRGIFFEITG